MRNAALIYLGLTCALLCCVAPGFAHDDSGDTQQLLAQVKALQENGTNNSIEQVPPPVTASLPMPNPTNYVYVPSNAYPPPSPPVPTANVMPPNPNGFVAPFANKQISQVAPGVSRGAFAGTVQSLLPMSPQQIHRLRQLYSASQYAAAAPPGVPPKPTATSLFVDLSPGASPPVINLAEGDITALVFLDSTGGSWPIEAIDNGNPSAFDIQWNKKDNVLLVQATTAFGRGNLAVRLRQLGPPVMITLVTNNTLEGAGGVVDYRVDLRIPGFGPNAQPVQGSGQPNPADPILLDVLDGIPPDGSKAMQVSNNVAQAWLKDDVLFLRTRLTLLSPAWIATMSSADGTNAYQLQKTPLLLMSQNGKVIEVKVKGF